MLPKKFLIIKTNAIKDSFCVKTRQKLYQHSKQKETYICERHRMPLRIKDIRIVDENALNKNAIYLIYNKLVVKFTIEQRVCRQDVFYFGRVFVLVGAHVSVLSLSLYLFFPVQLTVRSI